MKKMSFVRYRYKQLFMTACSYIDVIDTSLLCQ